jgi:nicotinate-nucleotide adenylyltransferase
MQGRVQIGLFGGSFDPPHRAHLALARAARDALALDELRWLPAGQPWQKSRALSAARHRMAMVESAIAGEPGMRIEPIEIERQGPSYTVDTVRSLVAREPGHTWCELLAQVRLAVAQRPGVGVPVPAEVLAHGFVPIPMPLHDISATEIRRRVAAGQDISQLVPPGVAGYIDQQGLYRPDPRS